MARLFARIYDGKVIYIFKLTTNLNSFEGKIYFIIDPYKTRMITGSNEIDTIVYPNFNDCKKITTVEFIALRMTNGEIYENDVSG